MDKTENRAITAIRNIAVESKIAESLHHLGWELIFRATNQEGLESALKTYPDAVLIAAEDFLIKRSDIAARSVWIDSTVGDYELQELLRNINLESTQLPTSIPLLSTSVSVVATVDSGIGGSALAINLAYESAQSGERTLLFDFNQFNPTFSRYFDLQHINRRFALTRFGFTIGEISGLSHFAEMAVEAQNYDHVIIDIGRSPTSKEILSGQRLHEVLSRWAIQSTQKLYLLVRGEELSLPRFVEKSEQLMAGASGALPQCVLISQSTTSARERRQLIDKASSLQLGEVSFLTRDVRNLSKAAIERTPLAFVAPKCVLAREISALYRRSHKGER